MNRPHPSPAAAPRDRGPRPKPIQGSSGTGWGHLVSGGIGILLVGAALWIGWSSSRSAHPSLGTPPDRDREIGRFELVERSGRPIRRAELENRVCVVSFVYTSCGTTCLAVTRNLSQLQDRIRDHPDIQLVSLTVDPETDTPSAMSQFAAQFGADPDRWWFLTGERQAIRTLIEASFLNRAVATPGLRREPMPGGFEGTSQLVLVDRRGKVRGYFDGLNPQVADLILRAARQLLAEPGI